MLRTNAVGAGAGVAEILGPVLDVPLVEARRDELLDLAAEQLLALVAEELLRAAVDEDDRAVLPRDDHGVGRRLEQAPEPLLAASKHVLRLAALLAVTGQLFQALGGERGREAGLAAARPLDRVDDLLGRHALDEVADRACLQHRA